MTDRCAITLSWKGTRLSCDVSKSSIIGDVKALAIGHWKLASCTLVGVELDRKLASDAKAKLSDNTRLQECKIKAIVMVIGTQQVEQQNLQHFEQTRAREVADEEDDEDNLETDIIPALTKTILDVEKQLRVDNAKAEKKHREKMAEKRPEIPNQCWLNQLAFDDEAAELERVWTKFPENGSPLESAEYAVYNNKYQSFATCCAIAARRSPLTTGSVFHLFKRAVEYGRLTMLNLLDTKLTPCPSFDFYADLFARTYCRHPDHLRAGKWLLRKSNFQVSADGISRLVLSGTYRPKAWTFVLSHASPELLNDVNKSNTATTNGHLDLLEALLLRAPNQREHVDSCLPLALTCGHFAIAQVLCNKYDANIRQGRDGLISQAAQKHDLPLLQFVFQTVVDRMRRAAEIQKTPLSEKRALLSLFQDGLSPHEECDTTFDQSTLFTPAQRIAISTCLSGVLCDETVPYYTRKSLDKAPERYQGERDKEFNVRLNEFHARLYRAHSVLAFLLVQQQFYLGMDVVLLRDLERKRNTHRVYGSDHERKDAVQHYSFLTHFQEAVQLSLTNELTFHEGALDLADILSKVASGRFSRDLSQLVIGYATETGVSGSLYVRSQHALKHLGCVHKQLDEMEWKEKEALKAKVDQRDLAEHDGDANMEPEDDATHSTE